MHGAEKQKYFDWVINNMRVRFIPYKSLANHKILLCLAIIMAHTQNDKQQHCDMSTHSEKLSMHGALASPPFLSAATLMQMSTYL